MRTAILLIGLLGVAFAAQLTPCVQNCKMGFVVCLQRSVENCKTKCQADASNFQKCFEQCAVQPVESCIDESVIPLANLFLQT